MIHEFQRKVAEALQPPATTIDEEILFWKPFDAAPIVYYVRFFGERACKVNVQSEHDKELAVAFLRELSPAQLDAVSETAPIHLSPSAVLHSTPFQQRALVHPVLIGGGLSKATNFIGPVTYVTFPAYRCEFTADDTRDEAAFRLFKVVRYSKWDRSPAPALSARYLRRKTGIKSTGGKRMGVFPMQDIEGMLGDIRKDDGFVDIENYERALVHVEHADGRYEVHEGDERWELRADAAVPWLRVFTIEGAETAKKKRGEYVA